MRISARTARSCIPRCVIPGWCLGGLESREAMPLSLAEKGGVGTDRSLDPGRGSRVARRRASARLGALRVAAIDAADEAALGRIRAHRLDELDLHHLLHARRRRRPGDAERTSNMHEKLVDMADAAAAHAAARAAVSDGRRAHFGAPLLVLLHRGGMACWICETRAPPGAAHVNRCSGRMDSCTRRALAGAARNRIVLMWRACMAV